MNPEMRAVGVSARAGPLMGKAARPLAPSQTGKLSSGVLKHSSAGGLPPPPPAPGASAAAKISAVIGELPAMPHVAAQVLEKLSDDDTTPREINQLITKDQALAARVLKVANSPFYGASRSVATLNDALMFLGFDSIRSLIMTTILKSMYSKVGFAEKLLWEHSVCCGMAARKIAETIGFRRKEEAYLAGLMHDVGKAALFWHAPELMREVIRDVLFDGMDFIESEQLLFGFTHAQVGGAVANIWCFVCGIEEAICGHHLPGGDRSATELSQIVNGADSISHKLGVGPVRKPDLDLNSVKSLKSLGLNSDQIEKIVKESKEALEADIARI